MPERLIDRRGGKAVPITPLKPDELKGWLAGQPEAVRAWVADTGFKAEHGGRCLVPAPTGGLERVLVGIDPQAPDGLFAWGGVAENVPGGRYDIVAELGPAAATHAALGWALGTYSFNRYKSPGNNARGKQIASLVWPKKADRAAAKRAAEAVFLVRDLINTPAADMGPKHLAGAAEALARRHKASSEVIVGRDLLARNYPAIHAVGRAAATGGARDPRAPRLIDLGWGRKQDPKVTLVGKGVCFDTGGLDLKPASAMKLMKKDMGGGAHVLGLAQMIMSAGLRVKLRVLIPAVENSVSGNAMRPLDVIQTRKGLTVEIGHTDAEGRVALADALAEAADEEPALVVDCATLTGAARVALGTDVPALFCNDDDLAAELMGHAAAEQDPLWRLPLWPGYRQLVNGKVGDLTNSPESPYAGAITAALFLQEFVGKQAPWIHLDMMAWNVTSRPGRPEGGEAMGIRALYALIAARFGGGRSK